jgi:hypothetical protein
MRWQSVFVGIHTAMADSTVNMVTTPPSSIQEPNLRSTRIATIDLFGPIAFGRKQTMTIQLGRKLVLKNVATSLPTTISGSDGLNFFGVAQTRESFEYFIKGLRHQMRRLLNQAPRGMLGGCRSLEDRMAFV